MEVKLNDIYLLLQANEGNIENKEHIMDVAMEVCERYGFTFYMDRENPCMDVGCCEDCMISMIEVDIYLAIRFEYPECL